MSDPNWPPPQPPEYTATTPSGPGDGEPASWGVRVGATLIDTLILIAVVFVLVLAAGGAAGEDGLGAGVIVAYVVAYLYAPLTMMRSGEHNGQTFGKQALGIRVRRDTGNEIGFWYSALRELLAKGILGPLTLGIDYLWPLWDKRNQALHDKVVGTFVVRS